MQAVSTNQIADILYFNDKNMVTNRGCNYTEMVILTFSFCLFALGFNHMMWRASFSFNQKEDDAESIMVKQFS